MFTNCWWWSILGDKYSHFGGKWSLFGLSDHPGEHSVHCVKSTLAWVRPPLFGNAKILRASFHVTPPKGTPVFGKIDEIPEKRLPSDSFLEIHPFCLKQVTRPWRVYKACCKPFVFFKRDTIIFQIARLAYIRPSALLYKNIEATKMLLLCR